MMSYMCWLMAILLPAVLLASEPSFQKLMDPNVFPDAQFGMEVSRAQLQDSKLAIVTTGAEMIFDCETGKAMFCQKIGHARPVVAISIDKWTSEKPVFLRNNPGLALARFASQGIDIRANGDSLFMFHAKQAATIWVTRKIPVAFSSSFQNNHLLLDEWGGFGLYCSESDINDEFNAYLQTTAVYKLPADGVLWVAVCPPKEYDWDRSISDHFVWHWSDKLAYPADNVLEEWSAFGNIVLLQSEVMLWKDWNLAFEPRLGPEEFARVRKTCHDHGMKLIVYTSPYYFLKGTDDERYAMNSFENFTAWPSGVPEGKNIDLFMQEIEKVMKEYKPDGLYFDGQYLSSPAALYELARRTRTLLGNTGIIEWHSTLGLGGGLCFLPQADAYVDFHLRGETVDYRFEDFKYLRYYVSCYNISNSIGVLCNNSLNKPTRKLIDQVLNANCRLHSIASWFDDAEVQDLMEHYYKPRLNANLRNKIDREGIDKRQLRLDAIDE